MNMNKYNIYIKYYIDRIINRGIIEAREKFAIKSLSKTSFRKNLRRYKYHMISDSSFMTRKSYHLVYPCYFQHG